MTSKLTRERIEQYANDPRMCNINDEIREMARMALAAMDSEPYGYVHQSVYEQSGSCGLSNDHEAYRDSKTHIALYRHAQQPVVPDAYVRDERGRMMLNGVCEPKIGFGIGWNACRSAMLQDGTLTNEDTNNCREIAETPTGFDNLTFDEHRKYIGLANIEIRRFQTIPDKKYIADLLTIAVNSLYESINTCGEVSSPAIPEGYVMVPKEPTDEMISSGIAAHYDRSQIQIHDRPAPGPMECAYVAMLAAADCSIPMISDRWVPVSERVPENDGAYLCWDKRYVTTYAFIFGAWQANQFIAKNITHWMPLPAAPQEVK